MSYTIRKIIPKEIKLFLDWAEKEGWNPGLHDGRPFLFTDPAGFLDNKKITSNQDTILHTDK